MSAAVAPKVRCRWRSPHGCRISKAPNAWPLRIALVPRPRFKEAKLLVLHKVQLSVEFDDIVIGVAEVDKDVVPELGGDPAPK